MSDGKQPQKMEMKNIQGDDSPKEDSLGSIEKKKIRFQWLDEFRGLVIILFTIQTLAYGLINKTGFHVIAPHLNHGYKYATIENQPDIITLIDLGQDIFLFLVGFMAAFSILKILSRKEPMNSIWKRIGKRFIGIMILNVAHMAGAGDLDAEHLLLTGTLATIAWVGLVAMIISVYVKKGDTRFYIGMGIFALHFILDLTLTIESMWMTFIGDIGVGITATAFSAWMFTDTGEITEEKFNSRILPVTFGSFVVMFLVEFIQWADHHRTTVALAMMTIGISGIAIFMFYKMEQQGFTLKFLVPFGKNMLLMFILEMVLVEIVYMDLFLYDYVLINPWLDLLLVGVVPIAFLYLIALFLAKKNIMWRV